MNTKLIYTALLFGIIFVFGFWLNRTGKPYNTIIFTIHKLITLAAVVFLAVTLYRVHQVSPLGTLQVAAVVVTALCFVAAMVSGGLLNIEKEMPIFVLRLHQVMPYMALLSTALTLYLVFGMQREMLTAL